MRLVRFSVAGQLHSGVVDPDGNLRSSQGERYNPDEVVWLPPVEPSKVIGLALNYAEHASELQMAPPDEPALFLSQSARW